MDQKFTELVNRLHEIHDINKSASALVGPAEDDDAQGVTRPRDLKELEIWRTKY